MCTCLCHVLGKKEGWRQPVRMVVSCPGKATTGCHDSRFLSITRLLTPPRKIYR